MSLKKYFEETFAVISKSDFRQDTLSIAGRNIHLKTPSEKLREKFLPSISHLLTDDSDKAEMDIYYADNDSLDIKIKAPEWNLIEFNGQGYSAGLDQENYQILFQPWLRQVYLYSKIHKTGIYWVYSCDEVPWWETTFSFRLLLHLWTRELPAQLIHSGAIASHEGKAWLITGPSGSGKSTTCMNLLNSGYKYLGDDYVWVEMGESPKVVALYQTAKLEADNFHERFFNWKEHILNPDTYLEQKAIFNMHKQFPDRWLNEAELKGVLLPVVSGKNVGTIMPTSSSRAFMAMAPTTLHHLPHNRAEAYEKIKNLSIQLPTFEWQLGTEALECERNFKNHLNQYASN